MLSRLLALIALVLPTQPAFSADIWKEPNAGIEFVKIPGGCFRMGSPPDAFASDSDAVNGRVRATETPQHEVCLDEFWLGRYEIRRAEWAVLMGTFAGATSERNLPVEAVSRAQAEEFAKRLTALSGGQSTFRLPSEAEWEYACRGGSEPETHRLPGRDHLDELAWYSSPYGGHPALRLTAVRAVGTRRANAFGLHDMLGNVWEWVQDDYGADNYSKHPLYNPVIVSKSGNGTIRGGSIHTNSRMMRCEARAWMPLGDTPRHVGFRLVRKAKR